MGSFHCYGSYSLSSHSQLMSKLSWAVTIFLKPGMPVPLSLWMQFKLPMTMELMQGQCLTLFQQISSIYNIGTYKYIYWLRHVLSNRVRSSSFCQGPFCIIFQFFKFQFFKLCSSVFQFFKLYIIFSFIKKGTSGQRLFSFPIFQVRQQYKCSGAF